MADLFLTYAVRQDERFRVRVSDAFFAHPELNVGEATILTALENGDAVEIVKVS